MIEILSESEGNTVGAKLTGLVSAEEYREVLAKEVVRRVEEHGRYRLVLVIGREFEGFAAEIQLDDPDYGLAHRSFLLERLALVGLDGQLGRGAELAGHFCSEWVKGFGADRLDEAWSWAKQHTSSEEAVFSVSELLGSKVVDHVGGELGKVHDLVLDASTGSVRLLVLRFGGVLGVGGKLHPIPWRLFHWRGDGTLVFQLQPKDSSVEKHLAEAPTVEPGHAWEPSASVSSFSSHPLFGGPRW